MDQWLDPSLTLFILKDPKGMNARALHLSQDQDTKAEHNGRSASAE